MANTPLINKDQYFQESKKAIQTVLQEEDKLNKGMNAADKLELVKELKEKTNSEKEFDELEKEQRELEKIIRFQKVPVDAIPKEHQKVVKRNVAVEQLEVDEKLNELKAELANHIEQLEGELLPLLTNINELEKLKCIPHQINLLTNATIGEGAPYPARALVQAVSRSSDEVRSSKALKELNELIGAIKGIKVPVETKGLLQYLKRGRK